MPRFFDFLSRSKETPEQEVELADLEKWLRSRIDREFDEVCREGEAILREIETARSAVREAADDFSKADIKTGELNQQLLPTIRNSKGSIATKTRSTISKLDIPRVQGFESLATASRNITQALAQMDQTLKTHGRIVSATLGKEIRPLLTELKQMQREAAGLSKIVEAHKEKAAATQKILEDTAQLNHLNADILTARSVIEDAEKGSQEVEEREKKIESTLKEVEHSKDYGNSQRIAEEEKRLSLELRKQKADFDTAFSKLKKPLEKYGHTVKLDKEKDRLLRLYTETPSTALIEDRDLAVQGFLKEAQTHVDEGKVTVKNPEKILRRINEIRTTLKNRRDSIVKTGEALEKIRVDLKKSPLRDAEDMRKALEEKRQSKEEQRAFIKRKRAEIEETAEMMKNLAAKIRDEAEETLEVRLKIQGLAAGED